VEPLLQWISIKCYTFWVCVCSLRYPTCSAHEPYCHLWPVQLDDSLKNGTFSKTRCRTQNVYFDFLYKFFSEEFFYCNKIERYIIVNVCMSSCKVRVILVPF